MHQQSNEITLNELLTVLWGGKWIILITTTIFFISSLVYVFFFQNQVATLNIEPLTSHEIESYAELNYLIKQLELDSLSPEQQDRYIEKKNEPIITAKFLISLLIERVRNRKDFLQSIQDINFIPQNNMTEEEWKNNINQFIYNIQFLPPSSPEELVINKSSNARLYWQVKVENVRNEEQYKQLLELTFKKSNEFVRKILLDKIENNVVLLKTKRAQRIEDIDIKIKNLREYYKTKTANRVAYLKEQAHIARKLEIAKNTLEAQTFGSSGIVATLQIDPPFYLRGFEAIEEELFLLQNRTLVDEFIPEVADLQQEKNLIVGSKNIERLAYSLRNSKLGNQEAFQSAIIDFNNIKFEPKIKPSILVFILVALGCVVSCVIVLTTNLIFKSRHLKKN